ncbi:short-chain dehydrogenase/reductase [Polychaeton citri CBS 116435]|uniref:Short-chain dehydrogenase/reductase n=1 Tax=Polychaeton citri CBS 116435 TaxID=1314669 RepID=A0A9P4UR27_9PEZI|nr:short-chain dehydrogenase/reductase [Polychaeton citri CBS 116435]
MSGPSPSAVLSLFYSQLTYHPPVPSSSFRGQTVIVTGANTGLGREVAKQIAGLGAERIILGVRTVSKGEEARAFIKREVEHSNTIDVWQLDLSSFESVRAFAKRAQGLDRLDVVVQNAGMWPKSFELAGGHEATVLTNVVSTFLLTKLLLPKMKETASITHTTPRITVVDSALHKFATLQAKKSPKIFEELKKPIKDYDGRYMDTKLLVILYGQKLAAEISTSEQPNVCINFVNPGWCTSGLRPSATATEKLSERFLVRTTDEGAKIIVDAVAADKVKGRQGAYLDEMEVKKPAPWINSKEGKKTAERIWVELNEIVDQASF